MDTRAMDMLDGWFARHASLRAELHSIDGWDNEATTDQRVVILEAQSDELMRCIRSVQEYLGSGSHEWVRLTGSGESA